MKSRIHFSPYNFLWTYTTSILLGWTSSNPLSITSRNEVVVPAGGDVSFSCHAGDYKENWIRWDRLDTGVIVAMETHVLISDPRFSVGLWENNTWTLSITNVQEEDQGTYRCEVNFMPSTMQEIFLRVVSLPRPPTIVMSWPHISIREFETLTLKCEARGYPKPTVTWTREDHEGINLRPNDISVVKQKEWSFVGEILRLPDVSRHDAGSYRCTANNSFPPVDSKIIQVDVTFKPRITVPNPMLVVPIGSEVKVNCTVDTSPMSLTYWTRHSGNMLFVGEEYAVYEKHDNSTMVSMTLIIRQLQRHHVGEYFCVAQNKHGRAEGKVEVYDFKPEIEALLPPKDPERNDITIDINPKRGQENVDSGSSKDQTDTSRLKPSYYNMLSFLRFFGLLMSFY